MSTMSIVCICQKIMRHQDSLLTFIFIKTTRSSKLSYVIYTLLTATDNTKMYVRHIKYNKIKNKRSGYVASSL